MSRNLKNAGMLEAVCIDPVRPRRQKCKAHASACRTAVYGNPY